MCLFFTLRSIFYFLCQICGLIFCTLMLSESILLWPKYFFFCFKMVLITNNCQANMSVTCGFCLGFPGLCFCIVVASLQNCGNDHSSHDLLLIPRNLYNAGFSRLIIISLVMQSGDFLSFNLAKALVSSSYTIGESITGGISSGSPMILSCDRVSLCFVLLLVYCSLVGQYQQIGWLLFPHVLKFPLVQV